MMKHYYDSVQNAFAQRQSLIIIGLTGRTGSGCSTTADILSTDLFSSLHLRDPKSFDFTSRDERKYEVIYKYMQAEKHWMAFSTISGSNIILSFILEHGFDQFIHYISKFENVSDENDVRISSFNDFKKTIHGIEHLFEKSNFCKIEDSLDSILSDSEKVTQYCSFYLKELPNLKKEFLDALSDYTCHREYINRFEQTKYVKTHLYTFLMQKIGNNIRCSGNPYEEEYTEKNFYDVAKRIDAVIQIIQKYNEIQGRPQTRICIDAIRNPYEAYYFKDKYSSFYLISINANENERKKRLGQLDDEELQSLDETEYESARQSDYGLFFHQTIPECLSMSDIHLYNPDIKNDRYYFLTEQIVKYISLILHPGLVNPTHIERCMQTAYVASLNSGCLSRQVGAVITGEDFSIKAVGWNEVPEGQVSCNLRCTRDYCKSKDVETFSSFELEDTKFQKALCTLEEQVSQCKLGGMTYSYCFKDVYNELKGGTKNQVFTRALHAEENAFLQLSKHGGQGIQGGKLFSTASPCELCSKKAYQLGIKEIYYIDPYPGISTSHILSFGKYGNPKIQPFFGAIGDAYMKLYTPRIPTKDELKLLTGIDCKKVVRDLSKDVERPQRVRKFKYIDQQNSLIFHSRTDITEHSLVKVEAMQNNIDSVGSRAIWTGSSFDGFELINCKKARQFESVSDGQSSHSYTLTFETPLNCGDQVEWEIKANMKDSRCIMVPYYTQEITADMEHLLIVVYAPKGILKEVRKVIYADTKMSKDLEVLRESIAPETDDELGEKYVFDVTKPNLMYGYAIEWEFGDPDESK